MNKFILYTLFAIKSFIVQPPVVPIPPVPPTPPSTLVIAFWGQSNAGDRGNGGSTGSTALESTAYASYLGTYSNTFYIDNTISAYLTRGVYTRVHGSACGADIGIVANIASSFTNIEIIKYFVGGTPLKDIGTTASFYPGVSGGFYELGFYKYDVSSFTQVNLIPISKVKPDIIVWIQGEQDANLTSTTYLQDLITFSNAARTNYNDQNIPIFYNQLHINYRFVSGIHEVQAGVDNVRAAQSAFQSSKNIMINMDDIPMDDPDGVSAVHYNTGPITEMGKRFATAIKTYYNITP